MFQSPHRPCLGVALFELGAGKGKDEVWFCLVILFVLDIQSSCEMVFSFGFLFYCTGVIIVVQLFLTGLFIKHSGGV